MPNWDVSPEGRSNDSILFREIVKMIAAIIRNDATTLLSGNTNSTARLILSQLAHGPYRMAPTLPTATTELDPSVDGRAEYFRVTEQQDPQINCPQCKNYRASKVTEPGACMCPICQRWVYIALPDRRSKDAR